MNNIGLAEVKKNLNRKRGAIAHRGGGFAPFFKRHHEKRNHF